MLSDDLNAAPRLDARISLTCGPHLSLVLIKRQILCYLLWGFVYHAMEIAEAKLSFCGSSPDESTYISLGKSGPMLTCPRSALLVQSFQSLDVLFRAGTDVVYEIQSARTSAGTFAGFQWVSLVEEKRELGRYRKSSLTFRYCFLDPSVAHPLSSTFLHVLNSRELTQNISNRLLSFLFHSFFI